MPFPRVLVSGALSAALTLPVFPVTAPPSKPSPVPKRLAEFKREAALEVDPNRYKTYLEQLGIRYPTIREAGQ